MFQAAVVAVGAMMAVLDHHQTQQQIQRTSGIAVKEIRVVGDRIASGMETRVRNRVQDLVSADERQFEAEPIVSVVESVAQETEAEAKANMGLETLSRLAVKAPRLLSQTLVSPREVKLLLDDQSGLRKPIA